MKPLKITEEDLKVPIENSWFWVSAYKDKKLVGTGRLISDGVLYAFICDMIVIPEYQKRGIRSTILKKLLEKCKKEKIRRVWLFSATDKSGFYEKHGFIRRPENAPGMQLGDIIPA